MLLDQTIAQGADSVGYLVFNDHIATAEAELVAAINRLQGVDDLILDIRYNGGGFLDIASELTYMISGRTGTFETLVFNSKNPNRNPVTNQPLTPTPIHTTTQDFSLPEGQPLPTLNLNRVYVITSPNTCSASESIMNGLRGVGVQVFQIGSTTCGKPFGFYAQDNCGTTYFSIQFQGLNAMSFGDYPDGFAPQQSDRPQQRVAARLLGRRRLHARARRYERRPAESCARLPRERQQQRVVRGGHGLCAGRAVEGGSAVVRRRRADDQVAGAREPDHPGLGSRP